MEDKFIYISKEMLKLKLAPKELALLVVLLLCSDDKGVAILSIKELMQIAGYATPYDVAFFLRDLTTAGLLGFEYDSESPVDYDSPVEFKLKGYESFCKFSE